MWKSRLDNVFQMKPIANIFTLILLLVVVLEWARGHVPDVQFFMFSSLLAAVIGSGYHSTK